MPIRYVLFDLDGTLLPMDQEVFIKAYFGGLAIKLAPLGYEPRELLGSIWKGTNAVKANDGSCTNEARFWQVFRGIYGERADRDYPAFEEFYAKDFNRVQESCGFDPRAAATVRELKRRGYTVALATNPVFPAVATECRIRWAGLEPEDFSLYTTYENSRFCKPTESYYRDVAAGLGADPRECLMVGNDVSDDMPAAATGMQVFLLTDCLIAAEGQRVEDYPHGSFEELMRFIEAQEG